MQIEDVLFSEGTYQALIGGVVGTLIAIGIMFAILIMAGIYIYFALTWFAIAKRLKYKNCWLAWIPFANLAMILQLGDFHWAWIFTIIFPPALLVIIIIATWRILEKLNFPGWFSLSLIIPRFGAILYLIILGFMAWGKGDKRITKIKKVQSKKVSKKEVKKKR